MRENGRLGGRSIDRMLRRPKRRERGLREERLQVATKSTGAHDERDPMQDVAE